MIMAAFDLFHSVVEGLSDADRKALEREIRRQREELLAARSEDERIRLVHEYIREVKELLSHR
jgi:hypothetical protein